MMTDKMKSLHQPTSSLYAMVNVDYEGIFSAPSRAQIQPRAGPKARIKFHPVDEVKELSLKDILELSDDLLFDISDEDLSEPMHSSFRPTPFTRQDSGIRSSNMPSYPFEIPEPTPIAESVLLGMKRAREEAEACCSSSEGFPNATDSNYDEEEHRFRSYQMGQWEERYEELVQYSRKYGHCLVPHTFQENLALARWVKRQRYQYKLMKENKPSTMTQDRALALESIGFVWDSQAAAWGERLDELRLFRQSVGHCNVPSNYAENPQLATWVKCQRRQYKLFIDGKPSNMTQERINMLGSLDFRWELRSSKKARHS